MGIDEAVEAVIRLNPHPECHAIARWNPVKQRHEFPIVSGPITHDLALQHVIGKTFLGAVGSDPKGSTTVVGVDLDCHVSGQNATSAASRFVNAANALQVPVALHTSKSGKGMHVRTLLSERLPAYLVRAMYVAIAISASVSNDPSFDKVWPPVRGVGVLALPYNADRAKVCQGTIALDPNTLCPFQKQDQFRSILEAEEMTRTDVEGVLQFFGIQNEKQARMLAGDTDPAGWNARLTRSQKEEADGGIQHMCLLCDAVKRLETEASTLSYEFWFSMMTNFHPFVGGMAIFEAYSSLDVERYDSLHLRKKWRTVRGGPRKCEHLEPGWVCPSREVCPARAPAGLPFAVRRMEKQTGVEVQVKHTVSKAVVRAVVNTKAGQPNYFSSEMRNFERSLDDPVRT